MAFYRAAPRVQCFEIFLESLLLFGLQTDEFDAHAKSRIAGAHKGAGRHLLRLNRQVDLETGSDGKRKDSLDVTAAAANVGGVLSRPCNRISSSELASDLLWTSHLPSICCSCAESQDLSNVRLLPSLALFRVHVSCFRYIIPPAEYQDFAVLPASRFDAIC